MKTVEFKDKTLHFVSTAHVSKQSVLDVQESIASVQPQAVCIELDDNRARNLMESDKYKEVDIKQIIKTKRVGAFIATLVLSSYQKKLADDLNTSVGQEMKQAIESAKTFNASIHYIDRDVQVTFKRIWGNLTCFKKISLLSTLILSVFEDDSVSEVDVENLKESDLLFESVREMDEKLPAISKSLLHERNAFMAEKIKALPEKEIVIVVGAAHTEGIIEVLDQDHSLYELNQIPAKKKLNLSGWIVPGIIILLLVALTLKNPHMALNDLLVWFALSGGLATLGAIICLAHPLTILTTALTAWIGTLSPVLGVGMFAGLMEAYQRPPTFEDFDALSTHATQPKMWFKNKVLRILLIFVITSLFSSIGTFIAGGNIIGSLFK
ncbi:TraB/GumN family protein [Erysipelothrix piscisicarius]|uniref:TraB/GumN family protein n=1 Tax=Erysipelothrix piscisicarius TaxID=2485784 RepID=A0A3S8RKY7_9FIRM|nr:TraB/GumN family protein [Erysipelothrix piscisicarius]AZK43497.1 TraB/GumN family protein [Erysipelothrix piscisicarius]